MGFGFLRWVSVDGDGELQSELMASSGLMVRFLDIVGLDVMVFSLRWC